LSTWEGFVSDEAGDADSLVVTALADAQLRRLSPFTSDNHASACLILCAVLRDEQVLEHAPLCLAAYFSRYAKEFSECLHSPQNLTRFYLRALTETAIWLTEKLELLREVIKQCREVVQEVLPRAPVDVLVQAVCQPICTNADLIKCGITRRQTAASYLKKLTATGMLETHRSGKEIHYVNSRIINVFSEIT